MPHAVQHGFDRDGLLAVVGEEPRGGRNEVLTRGLDRLGLASYALMAHDTGGTIARRLATLDTARIACFVIIGTEIPNHRPPWIEFFHKISTPERTGVLRFLLNARWFRHSIVGFAGCFFDESLIESDFKTLLVDPVVQSMA